MLLNLLNLRSELKLKLKNNSIGTDRLDNWINLAQEDIVSEMDPDHLIFNQTITTVANQRKYYIDVEFNKILNIVNVTNNLTLTPLSENDLEDFNPDQSNTGTAYYYAVYGLEWVKAQPLTASTVDIVSDSASDTTQKIRINGVVNLVDDTELLTLNGLSVVTGTKSFSKINFLSRDNVTVGKITVNVNDADNTVIGTYGPNELIKQYQPIVLYYTPGSADSLRIRGIRRPKQLINVQDFPDLPQAYHELVLTGAAVRGHRDLMRPTLAQDVYKFEYIPMISKLKREMGDKRFRISPVIRGTNFILSGPPWGKVPLTVG